MFKKRKSLLTFVIILILGIFVTFLGCAKTSDETANKPDYFYSQVQLGMEKSQVESSLAVEPEEDDQNYIYTDDQTGFGVQIGYDAGDMVLSKTLHHKDNSKIMGLSDASVSEDQITSISEGMTYDEVVALLGSEGTEIIEMAHPIDVNTPIVMMIWFNDDETGFYITFLGHQGTVMNYEFWK